VPIQKRAFITGIAGQDGYYLTQLLLSKGYFVSGLVQNLTTATALSRDVELIAGDLTDSTSLQKAIKQVKPDEVYHLGGMSNVARSYDEPERSADINGMGTLRLLEAVHAANGDGHIRYYQASSSEIFGRAPEVPQTEQTLFHPWSPYGVSKVFAHLMTINYRERFGMHASCGILYNHESPLRPEQFVTRKITAAAARIKLGLQKDVTLGNLDAERDWGFAGDYVEGMWLMLQQDQPSDYILASGKTHSIRDVLDVAFSAVGIDDWVPYVKQDPQFMRPQEGSVLIGNPDKAKKQLGWKPKVSFEQLIQMMVEADLKAASSKLK
jgi:GDPmannose 4,6-dehydratase